MESIDRADWHYGGKFPNDLPKENGGTHIGMYLTWIIENDLIGEIHLKNSFQKIQDVKHRNITGRDFLFTECDEKFWKEDLTDIGNEFTEFYYSSETYGNDYSKKLINDEETIYHILNNWENYDKLKPIIDKRFKKWKAKKNKKSWEFWK